MELKLFKALWGMEGTYQEQFARAADAGYAGIECPLPSVNQESLFRELLEKHQLSFIAQIVTTDDHTASFAEQLERAATFQPVLIVSHSARDAMPEEEQDRFFESALALERQFGVPVGHETHRSRAMFTPWTTARLLKKFPALKITADFSHWCNVCESLLEDHEDSIALAAARTIHTHGRIGYAQGPQVPHPGAPEYAVELQKFTGWWRQIYEAHKSNDARLMTFTAEFGPPGYMHTLPYVNQPIVDQWTVNEWMTRYFEARFEDWSQRDNYAEI